jgi:hypothetical protein
MLEELVLPILRRERKLGDAAHFDSDTLRKAPKISIIGIEMSDAFSSGNREGLAAQFDLLVRCREALPFVTFI